MSEQGCKERTAGQVGLEVGLPREVTHVLVAIGRLLLHVQRLLLLLLQRGRQRLLLRRPGPPGLHARQRLLPRGVRAHVRQPGRAPQRGTL
jgi:hypothetical protein